MATQVINATVGTIQVNVSPELKRFPDLSVIEHIAAKLIEE